MLRGARRPGRFAAKPSGNWATRSAKHKSDLGKLVSLEAGKILAEGEGEVQEMIDICDFAVGQSRMLYGLTIQSERASHRLMEQWHPLGLVGVISAFNFPVAVWSWNAALAAVCGDATIWKPSEKTPLTAIAVIKIAEKVCRATGVDSGIFTLAIGDGPSLGQKMAQDRRVPLVSATGSTRMGFDVAQTVHGRLGRTIMELGGNNALIVTPSADLKMAASAIFFGSVGTAGQRCTSTRRVIMHESIAKQIEKALTQGVSGREDRQSSVQGNADGTAHRYRRGRERARVDPAPESRRRQSALRRRETERRRNIPGAVI